MKKERPIVNVVEIKRLKPRYTISTDEDTWLQFKSKCALDKIPMNEKIIELIKKYTEK